MRNKIRHSDQEIPIDRFPVEVIDSSDPAHLNLSGILIHYTDDHEAGLTWGFVGRLPGNEAAVRMYAPRLADGKALGYRKLREMYPAGMQMKVWYNPEVTGTLFQHRTLRGLPHTPDLVKAELAVIYHWINYCLLPFLGALMLTRVLKER